MAKNKLKQKIPMVPATMPEQWDKTEDEWKQCLITFKLWNGKGDYKQVLLERDIIPNIIGAWENYQNDVKNMEEENKKRIAEEANLPVIIDHTGEIKFNLKIKKDGRYKLDFLDEISPYGKIAMYTLIRNAMSNAYQVEMTKAHQKPRPKDAIPVQDLVKYRNAAEILNDSIMQGLQEVLSELEAQEEKPIFSSPEHSNTIDNGEHTEHDSNISGEPQNTGQDDNRPRDMSDDEAESTGIHSS